jgi:hypothetical protein
MTERMSPWLRIGTLVAVLASIAASTPSTPREHGESTPTIDPKADAVLKRMSSDMAALQSFRFVGESSTEGVLKNGEKLQFDATSQVAVRRPDKLRSDRVGGERDVAFFYNGQQIAVLGKRMNVYATTPAPHNLDEAIDYARARFGLDAPAADLLLTNSYGNLTRDVLSGQYLGEDVVDGVACDHIAFRGKDTDFQLWVEKGPRALPRKYVITSKDVAGQPEFTIALRDWQVNPNLPDSEFNFVPPPGADRIDFLKPNQPGATGAGGDVGGGR